MTEIVQLIGYVWELLNHNAWEPSDGGIVLYGWEQLALGAASLVGSLLSKKKAPKKVPYEKVDAQKEQRASLEGNLDALPLIEELLTQSQNYQQDSFRELLERANPGMNKLVDNLQSMADERLTNPYELPPEVEANMQRLAAERGMLRGTSGQFEDFNVLRDMGLNYLNFGNSQMQQGANLLGMVNQLRPTLNPASPMSMFVSPQAQISLAVDNNTKKQKIDQGYENAATAVRNENRAMLAGAATNFVNAGIGALGNAFGGAGASGLSFIGGANPPAGTQQSVNDLNQWANSGAFNFTPGG